jgi:hypothetical protein
MKGKGGVVDERHSALQLESGTIKLSNVVSTRSDPVISGGQFPGHSVYDPL